MLLAAFLTLNAVSFALFWLDKRSARRSGPRVPENKLLLLAIFGGWPGLKLGQRLLRHKTRKQPFGTRLNLMVALNLIGLAALYTARFTDTLFF